MDKLPDISKTQKGGYTFIKNGIGTGPIPLRKWTPLKSSEKNPHPYQRTGKDTGVV